MLRLGRDLRQLRAGSERFRAASSSQFEPAAHERDLGGGCRRRVDLYTAPELERALAGLLKKGATQLVVDFTLATFIDSTALHVLLRAARQLNGKEGELVVVAPDPNVCKVFEITGLNRLFAVESSLSTVSVPS